MLLLCVYIWEKNVTCGNLHLTDKYQELVILFWKPVPSIVEKAEKVYKFILIVPYWFDA